MTAKDSTQLSKKEAFDLICNWTASKIPDTVKPEKRRAAAKRDADALVARYASERKDREAHYDKNQPGSLAPENTNLGLKGPDIAVVILLKRHYEIAEKSAGISRGARCAQRPSASAIFGGGSRIAALAEANRERLENQARELVERKQRLDDHDILKLLDVASNDPSSKPLIDRVRRELYLRQGRKL